MHLTKKPYFTYFMKIGQFYVTRKYKKVRQQPKRTKLCDTRLPFSIGIYIITNDTHCHIRPHLFNILYKHGLHHIFNYTLRIYSEFSRSEHQGIFYDMLLKALRFRCFFSVASYVPIKCYITEPYMTYTLPLIRL